MRREFRDSRYGSLASSKYSDDLPPPVTASPAKDYRNIMITLFLIILWWVLCAEYNINNKLAAKYTPAPLTIASIQLSAGCFWFIPLWLTGIRPAPRFHSAQLFITKLAPQGACHCLVHVGAVFSMFYGAVSFCHIVKAFEPVTTSILSVFVLKHFFSLYTYAALIPVIGGVIIACFSTPSFNVEAFAWAMVSNVGSSARGVFAKKTMSDPKALGKNLTPPNIYACITLVAMVICWPLAFAMEGLGIYTKWGTGIDRTLPAEQQPTNLMLVWYLLSSSFMYYFFNELAFFILGRVDSLTHSVSNTVKRVYIIFRSASVEKPLTLQAYVGSGVAIAGTFLFSYSKQKWG